MDKSEFRKRIDAVDEQLVRIFSERMDIAGEIALLKKEEGMPVRDAKREKEKIASVAALLPEEYREYAEPLYSTLLALSRNYQNRVMGLDPEPVRVSVADGSGPETSNRLLKCGLLGEKLGHSYSPEIHRMLADYDYDLYEVEPDKLEEFVLHGEWDGLNVTIPYKKEVVPLCRSLSEFAKKTGSVNVLVRHFDGSVTGDNTDGYGFEKLLERSGFDVRDKKALILGNGGACASVNAVLKEKGCRTVIISRTGEDNYGNLDRHADAEIIVNTTPVGMYPDNGKSPVNLEAFPNCRLALDLIYNPARTALMMQAETLGIENHGGLYMLVAQAKRACELFSGKSIPDSETDRIEAELSANQENIVLIGMPGCGKTTVAGLLGIFAEKEVIETDKLIAEKAGMSIPEYLEKYGEEEFRKLETQVISEVSKLSDKIISTGGGCVTVAANYWLLHQNSRIIWLKRDLNKLASVGRPLSQKKGVEELYRSRKDAYDAFADYAVDNNGEAEETAKKIARLIFGK